MCGIMTVANADMQNPTIDLSIAAACQAAEVDYDDFTLAVAAGSYPCLPLPCGGAGRAFDETDLLALYIYGRLLAFGFGALRAGEYACRMHAAIKTNANARSVSIALTEKGGKRVVIEDAATAPDESAFPGRLAFDIPAIRQFLKARTNTAC